MSIGSRVRNAWNAFRSNDKSGFITPGPGESRPTYNTVGRSWSKSDFSDMVFNRIAVDASMVDIVHVKVDDETGNQIKMSSKLQDRLSYSANIDQTGRAFMHDLVESLLEQGAVAVVPTDTSADPKLSQSYDILSMRVGEITQWYPENVKVNLYNQATGKREEIILPKKDVAVIESPLYSVINAKNGTLGRLINKLQVMDKLDAEISKGSMNMILQLPYSIRNSTRREEAEERIASIEKQLEGSSHGIAYVDGTEKITQLNRPVTNNIIDEVKYLTQQFYNQLGLTETIFNGTATETAMRYYFNETIDPIVEAILSEFNRKFISKTARTQGQKLTAYRDPFKLVPTEQIASAVDTFSRNAVTTPNESRAMIGLGPNADPTADELGNRNIADVNQNTALPSTSMAAPGQPTQ